MYYDDCVKKASPQISSVLTDSRYNSSNQQVLNVDGGDNTTRNLYVGNPTNCSDIVFETKNGNISQSALRGLTTAATSGESGGSVGITNNVVHTFVDRTNSSPNDTYPINNRFVIKEHSASASDTPVASNWHYILAARGSDSNYGVQLSMGMTVDNVSYRRYGSGSWHTVWPQFVDVYKSSGGGIYWDNMNANFSNCNNINLSGIGCTIGGNPNLPSDGWGTLISFCLNPTVDGQNRMQIWYGWNSKNTYIRHCYNGTWENWGSIVRGSVAGSTLTLTL